MDFKRYAQVKLLMNAEINDNFCVVGLVNGNQGIVKQIMWFPNKDSHQDLPAVVFVVSRDHSGMYTYCFVLF